MNSRQMKHLNHKRIFIAEDSIPTNAHNVSLTDATDDLNQSGIKTLDLDMPVSVSQHQEDALDEALKESFPASDPVAIRFQ
jgi:hypothetical protein